MCKEITIKILTLILQFKYYVYKHLRRPFSEWKISCCIQVYPGNACMCRLQSIVEIPDKKGKSLVGIEIYTLVSHDGQSITFAVGYNKIGNLRGQGDLHGHRRLPPRYSNDFAKQVSGNILGARIER